MTAEYVAIVSGGMDSTTLAYVANDTWPGAQGVHVSFNYGQRHAKELAYARATATRLGARHIQIDLPLSAYLPSALTSPDIDVPEGHYAADNMAATVVPNRNAIMLSIAWGIATAESALVLYTGVHAGDHPIYPDCRPSFIWTFGAALKVATDGYAPPELVLEAPFLHSSKADIAALGNRLGVPWAETWSCYVGGEVHCGACGTCYERREAFQLAGVEDPTVYAATPTFVAP